MSEMIDRVRKAMDAAGGAHIENDPGLAWGDIPLEVFARAAIEAMREPTKEMETCILVAGGLAPEDVWPAMIDAALK